MRGINKGTGIAKYMTVSRVFLFGIKARMSNYSRLRSFGEYSNIKL